jgi:hypothetical protein
MMTRRYLLPALVLLGAFWLPARPASAEGNCPTGSYPTHDQNGQQNGCYPVYDPNQGATGPTLYSTRPPPPKPASYFSVFSHPDSNDVWAVWNHYNLYDAGYAAYTVCMEVMGDGCELLTQGSNMTVTVARDQNGGLAFGRDKISAKSRTLAEKTCADNKLSCQFLHQWTAKLPKKGQPHPEAYFAGASSIMAGRGVFAAGFTDRFDRKDELWISSGLTSDAGAQNVAKVFCTKTNRRRGIANCWAKSEPEFTVGSGFALIFRDTSGGGGAVAGSDKLELERQATAQCMARNKAPCAAGAFIDSKVRRDQLVNFSKLPNWPKGGHLTDLPLPIVHPGSDGPTGTGLQSGMTYRSQPNANAGGTFSAQAWINSEKHNAHVWKYMVWSVSGGKDGASTSEAALQACQAESGFECELVASTQDTRIVLYTDEQHAMRVSQTHHEVDSAPLIIARCKDQRSNCRVVKVIDSHAPLIERIEVR